MVKAPVTCMLVLSSCQLLVERARASPSPSATESLVSKKCAWNSAGPLRPPGHAGLCPTVIDDEAVRKRQSWAPWTHRPICAHPANTTESKYCIYSFSPLRGESGVSFVTTPEVAAGIVKLLDDPNPAWEPWTPTLSPFLTSDGPLYEIVDIPGKGKGVIARRHIRRGEVIMRNQPVMMGLMYPPRSIGARRRQMILEQAFNQLPLKERKRVLEMARSGNGHILDDILRTNIFGVRLDDGDDHMGLFPDIARINHACKPNCHTRFSRRRLIMEAVAYQDIEPGEELSISYTPLNLVTADRQELIKGWGFRCTCDLCSSPEDAEISDRNRLRIQDILARLDDGASRDYDGVAKLTSEILDLIAEEGLSAQIGDFYIILAEVYLRLGHVPRAREFATLAFEKLSSFVGEDSEQAAAAKSFLEKLPP